MLSASHFLDDLLFEQKLREVFLQLVVQLLEGCAGLLRLGLGGAAPSQIFFVHLGVLLPHLFDETMKRLDVFLAGLDDLVDRNPVEPLLGGIGCQLFGQGNMLLGGEAQAVQDALDLKFGSLDSLGNLHLLLTGQQRHLPHLLEVHANRIVQNVQPAFFGLARRLDRLLAGCRVQLLNNLHFKTFQLGENLIQFLGAHQLLG